MACKASTKMSLPESEIKSTVIFDIDGTLMNNFYRQIAIFEEKIVPQYPPNSADLPLPRIKDLNPNTYSVLVTFRDFYPRTLFEDTIKPLFEYYFLSNEFLHYDHAIDGAAQVIKKFDQPGWEIIFLTGRPSKEMREGTLKSLERFHFLPNQAKWRLIMKQDYAMPDSTFKSKMFNELAQDPAVQVIAVFDNEPAPCAMAASVFPQAFVVQFLSNADGSIYYHGPKMSKWV